MKVKQSFGHKAVILSLSKLEIKSKNFFYKSCYLRKSHKMWKLSCNFWNLILAIRRLLFVTPYLWLAICYLLSESFYLKLAIDRFCITKYGHSWSCMALFVSVWSCKVLYEFICPTQLCRICACIDHTFSEISQRFFDIFKSQSLSPHRNIISFLFL